MDRWRSWRRGRSTSRRSPKGEVLVRVHAASIHVGDWILMTGTPRIMRLGTGLRKPKNPIPGTDIAGIVEAIGPNVQSLRPGDEVFGWCSGAFAEYASRTGGSADQEAGEPDLRAGGRGRRVRNHGPPAPSRRRRRAARAEGPVNGASGGVGSFAVQIAKAFGAEVTGVSSTKNLELLRSIGADHVVDYTRDDFRAGSERYDVILDNVGDHSMADTRRALAPTGILISNGGGHSSGKLGRVIRERARVDGRAPAGTTLGQDPEPRRPRGPEGSRRSRQGHPGHRRHVPAGPDGRGHRSCRGRTRARDARHRRDSAVEPRRPASAHEPWRPLRRSTSGEIGATQPAGA